MPHQSPSLTLQSYRGSSLGAIDEFFDVALSLQTRKQRAAPTLLRTRASVTKSKTIMAREYQPSSLRCLTIPCSILTIAFLLLPNFIFYCGPLNSSSFICLAFPTSLGTVIMALLINFIRPTHGLLLSYFVMVIALNSIFVGFVMGSWVSIPNSEEDVNWTEMEGCLRTSEICGCHDKLYLTSMKSIMVACCQEPASCSSSNHRDCCPLNEPCRAIVFSKLKSNWKRVNIVSTVIVGLLLLVYITHVFLYGSSITHLRW
ncbi:hypothetical protein NE237_029220 [Protea cynaroides]|uniref:Uncharacterized protein n=1 Tax=Protea cynaroides TaxID=273540 RepID=A0A9Q0GTI2_9MAGN|nr:hypothetical protein NE237_029220 [Protea cynaroides]